MIRSVPAVAAMAPYPLADLEPEGSVSLAQNESAFPASAAAILAGREALECLPLYPDPNWSTLRAAIALVHGVDADRILCGAGSMELIRALIGAFAGPEDEVLGTEYGYLFVATSCQLAGARHVKAPETDLAVNVDAILDAVTERTKVVFLCSPGNPTGTRIPNAEILRLRQRLTKNVLLAVDQAYGEFDSQDSAPIFALTDRGDTVVLRTFSKAYGLAGARIGWGLFPGSIGKETRKLLNPNNVSAVSQAMATAAMLDQISMSHIVAQTVAIRTNFVARLSVAGYAIPESHTNFVLIPFSDPVTAACADERLRREGIFLRGMGGYGLPHCLRATIAHAEVMDRVADILVSLQ